MEKGIKTVLEIEKFSRFIISNEEDEFFITDSKGDIISESYTKINYIRNRYCISVKKNPRELIYHWSAVQSPRGSWSNNYVCNEFTMFILDIVTGETIHQASKIYTYDNMILFLKDQSYTFKKGLVQNEYDHKKGVFIIEDGVFFKTNEVRVNNEDWGGVLSNVGIKTDDGFKTIIINQEGKVLYIVNFDIWDTREYNENFIVIREEKTNQSTNQKQYFYGLLNRNSEVVEPVEYNRYEVFVNDHYYHIYIKNGLAKIFIPQFHYQEEEENL